MRKIAVIIYGPPGSGKGTQADLLAKALNLVHFDTGAQIEAVVYDPKNQNNKLIQKQRHTFDTGGICDPWWVAELAEKAFRKISKAGLGLVLSGSLRTLFETFGDHKTKGLLKVLEEEYGRNNIFFFLLKVNPKSSIKRNSSRLICSVCGKPVLHQYLKQKPFGCPVCGGKLRARTLDNPAVIEKRLVAYQAETAPVFAELRKRGYKIAEVNGEPAPYVIQKNILEKIK